MATVAATDLQAARALEPHLDAVAILDELDGRDVPAGTSWGVFAAEGPGVRLEAHETADGWVLDGTKPWCSLAGRLSHALVTAWLDDDARGLFAVDLRAPGVTTGGGTWVARGLPEVVSTPIHLAGVRAEPVGGRGWYLDRHGFAWGGIGVAAVWYGGAVGVARRLLRQAAERELDQVGRAHLGAVDRTLHAARAVLAEAADDVDAGRADGPAGAVLALRVRAVVVDAVESVLRHCDHALGPGPLVGEPAHAAAVADLHLYVRQHHAERDDAALGGAVTGLPDDGRAW
ncbi:acyl-CoA dehydrogenase [Nocardioides dongxiaopingii]|nr:acyl-CoA dehydrogenase family protein [Nocardioides dongxiaopingii]QCW52354.1 acyl-CoA dehydrogenase [Nocardioides sp. S-1144]